MSRGWPTDAMLEHIMKSATAPAWRSIAALNAVSTLSQIGQFGVGFVVLPLWLSHRGLSITQSGIFAAAQWAGMLFGIYAAQSLMARYGARPTVLLGLLSTIAALAITAVSHWPGWLLPAFFLGLGIGLRWIANETWLYSLIPEGLSGRVVGVHETLISMAGIVGPALAMWSGVNGATPLLLGSAITATAVLPLMLTAGWQRTEASRSAVIAHLERPALGGVVKLGLVVAAVAGLGDGALLGLIPKFCAGKGLTSAQCATLLTFFGLGGMVCQYPVGWLADKVGLMASSIVCAAVGVAASVILGLDGRDSAWAIPAIFALGGANNAFLTLGVFTVASTERAQLDRLMRLVSLTFTAGAIIGPLIAALVMQAFGTDALMWQVALCCIILFAYAFGLLHGTNAKHADSHSCDLARIEP